MEQLWIGKRFIPQLNWNSTLEIKASLCDKSFSHFTKLDQSTRQWNCGPLNSRLIKKWVSTGILQCRLNVEGEDSITHCFIFHSKYLGINAIHIYFLCTAVYFVDIKNFINTTGTVLRWDYSGKNWPIKRSVWGRGSGRRLIISIHIWLTGHVFHQ